MDALTALKSIGRTYTNVIMREAKAPAASIIADLHGIRVTHRIGLIPETNDGIKVKKTIDTSITKKYLKKIAMAISFLGREICRPTPRSSECPINGRCKYYRENF